jgi:hypothetical protein
MEICTSVDVVHDNPIIGNDANTIATTPPTAGSGVQNDANPIGTKLYIHLGVECQRRLKPKNDT